MRIKILILVASIALIVLTGGSLLAGEIKGTTLYVTGMTCKLCPRMVKKAISNVDGVETVDIRYKEKEAHVKYDVDETGVKGVITAVEKAGYGVSLKVKGP